jgi:hypothetical protein
VKWESKIIVYEQHVLGFLANSVTARNDADYAESTLKELIEKDLLITHIVSDEVCEDRYVALLVLLHNSILRVKEP